MSSAAQASKPDSLDQYRRHFQRGDTIFVEGADCDGFYVIESGSFDAFYDGRKIGHVDTKDGPEFVGEVAALLGTQRTATVRAVTELDALWIPTADMEVVMQKNPNLAMRLTKSLCRKLISSKHIHNHGAKRESAVVRNYMTGLLSMIESAAKRSPGKGTQDLLSYFKETNPWRITEGDVNKRVTRRPVLDI